MGVSSTSWTPDEDFSVLLRSLVLYEQHCVALAADSQNSAPPRLLFVITGFDFE